MNIFFTSDLHFGHKKVIQYSKRPFTDHEDMTAQLIKNWNETVPVDGLTYIVGDLTFYSPNKIGAILSQLNGKKRFIKGNHDKGLKEKFLLTHFEWVKDMYTVKVEDPDAHGDEHSNGIQRIVLCHYPLRSWEKMHKGAWHLHGHCHGNLKNDHGQPFGSDGIGKSLDVGVDCWNYRPVSYETIKEIMSKRQFKSVDHHAEKFSE